MGTLEDLFDPERLRKNWVAEPEATQQVVHQRLVDVAPAFDLSGTATDILTRIRAIAALRFPQHRATLELFFERAFKELEGVEGPDAQAAREALLTIIGDMQELIEAWILTER